MILRLDLPGRKAKSPLNHTGMHLFTGRNSLINITMLQKPPAETRCHSAPQRPRDATTAAIGGPGFVPDHTAGGRVPSRDDKQMTGQAA